MATLLDLEQPVPDGVIARLAAAPESRKAVYLDLTARGAIARMPAKYRLQPMLAEGEVAAEFDEILVPSKIVLAKVIHVDTKTDGMLDVYIFKLRSGDTWSIGVTGAYLRKDTPTTKLYGATRVESESAPPRRSSTTMRRLPIRSSRTGKTRWATFDRPEPLLDRRLAEWRASR